MPNQYANPNNVLAHYETTGPEIMQQTGGDITHFVAGMGTSGTLMGTARYFAEAKPEVQVIGIEPMLGHKIQGLKNMREAIVPPYLRRSASCPKKSSSRTMSPLKPPAGWRSTEASSAACPAALPWPGRSAWQPSWSPARSW